MDRSGRPCGGLGVLDDGQINLTLLHPDHDDRATVGVTVASDGTVSVRIGERFFISTALDREPVVRAFAPGEMWMLGEDANLGPDPDA